MTGVPWKAKFFFLSFGLLILLLAMSAPIGWAGDFIRPEPSLPIWSKSNFFLFAPKHSVQRKEPSVGGVGYLVHAARDVPEECVGYFVHTALGGLLECVGYLVHAARGGLLEGVRYLVHAPPNGLLRGVGYLVHAARGGPVGV